MLQVSLISIFRKSLLIGLLCLSWSQAYSAEFCSDQFYIEATLPNESKWDLCWEHRDRDGIVYHHVFYTPKNGSRTQILYKASIAQIHVPYDDNIARYHDVTDYGIGGSNMQDLASSECPNGTLKKFNEKNVICQQIEKGHIAHHADSGKKHGNALSLFSISKISAYHYLPQWRFFDDGTIQPSMGATGALQRFGSGVTDHGWQVNSNRTGIAHLHNFFWRLDFDLGESGTDDYVEEFNFPLSSGKRVRSVTKFSSEKAREVNPSTLRSWRVVDGSTVNNNGHKKSYEIRLDESGHKDKGPSNEPYTHNDFFVTKSKDCEKYASHNRRVTSNDCKKNLAEFVDGENLIGQDIIVWVGLTFYHMPRIEDAPHMDAHWNHFDIVPRDWHANNPLGTDNSVPVNTAPSITTPGAQANEVGDTISLNVIATDAENNSLNYSASGLPSGLSINTTNGKITGTITAGSEGGNSVTITVSDGQLSDATTFNWQVSAVVNNTPPLVTNPGNQTYSVGETVRLLIIATDVDSDTLTYSASGLVSGLAINSSTGVISGTIGAGSEDDHNITITVNDGTASISVTFKLKINPLSIESPTHQLPNNEWHQISLPMNSGTNNKVSDIFGDDGLGLLGTDWALFRFDGNSNDYVVLGENDELNQGVGYWIVQTTGATRTLDMPAGSTQTLTTTCSAGECVEIPLATKEGAKQWNMIGYPFDAQGHLSDARIATIGAPCSSGCSMIEAETKNISENKLWAYDGSDYVIVDTTNDSLDPWQGFWIPSLSAANGKKPSLVISKP